MNYDKNYHLKITNKNINIEDIRSVLGNMITELGSTYDIRTWSINDNEENEFTYFDMHLVLTTISSINEQNKEDQKVKDIINAYLTNNSIEYELI